MGTPSTSTVNSTPSNGERYRSLCIALYASILTLCTLIHLVFLLFQNIDMREELGVKTSIGTVIGGYACPTWLPLAVVCVIWLGGFMILMCRTKNRTKKKDWILFLKIITAIFNVMVGVLYPVQVAIYLGTAVDMYLDKFPSRTICYCGPLVSALLPYEGVHMCKCRVPFHHEILPVYTNSTEKLASNDSMGDTLKDIGVTYRGQVEVIPMNTRETMEEMADDKWSYTSTMKMLSLLQLCLVLIFLRFPVWIVLQRYSIIKELCQNLIMRISNRVHAEEVIQEPFRYLRNVSTHFAIEVCSFGFLEGADAFCLLEEVFTYRDHYAANRTLSCAVVVFISLTLIVTTIANICSVAHEWSNLVLVGTKLVVVILCNLPFFVIRMYVFVLHQMKINTVFLVFSVKELAVLVLSGAEVIFGFYKAHIEAQAPANTA